MHFSSIPFRTPRITLLVLGLATATALPLVVPHPGRAQVERPANMTLMGTLAEWSYPGASMPDGATMSDGGNPLQQSVKCAAILSTPDPVEKVIKYYTEKLAAHETREPVAGKGEANRVQGQSVTAQDDSRGRSLALRVFVVNRRQSSTTLVISRAAGERETHIAWSHYQRLDAAATKQGR